MRRLIIVFVFMLASCGGANTPTATVDNQTFRASVAADDGDDGATIKKVSGCWMYPSFPISWRNAPAKTQSFAIVVRGQRDSTADFLYGLVYNIMPDQSELVITYEMGDTVSFLRYNGTVGKSSFGVSEILNPCYGSLNSSNPPRQTTVTVYALDLAPTLDKSMKLADFEAAIKGAYSGTKRPQRDVLSAITIRRLLSKHTAIFHTNHISLIMGLSFLCV